MALDYYDEHDAVLNPAKCAKCGGDISLNIKPADDSVWDEHDLPAKGDEFNPAIHQWEHTASRTGKGGIPLPPGRFEEAKARLADLTHAVVPHDNRTLEQENTSRINQQDPTRSRARTNRRMQKVREDAEFQILTRNSGMMGKEEQGRADAEHNELMTNGSLQRDVPLTKLNRHQFPDTPENH